MKDNQIWTAKELQKILGTEVPESYYGKIQFNSKEVEKGDLFIALPGNKTDGHEYVHDALGRGASAAIVDRLLDGEPLGTIIKVDNTKKALIQLAEYKRNQSRAKVIAITGSVGKTTTKDLIYEMLSNFGKVFKSRGNFNNELGLSVNLASMPAEIEYCIIELGMSQAGEISVLTKVVRPDIALITNVAPAHLAFFNSVRDIAKAKFEIFEGLNKNQGIAIINHDNEFYDFFNDSLKQMGVNHILSFGQNLEANVIFKECSYSENSTKLVYKTPQGDLEIIKNDLIPKHLGFNFTSVLTIALALNLDLKRALEVTSKMTLGEGRGKIINYGKFKLIADYYNASPASMKASLEFLKILPFKHKTVIIGDMRELGDESTKLHLELLPYILESNANQIVCIGQYSHEIFKHLPENIIRYHFNKVEDCFESLPNIINSSDIILLKESKSIGLKKIAEYLNLNFKDKNVI